MSKLSMIIIRSGSARIGLWSLLIDPLYQSLLAQLHAAGDVDHMLAYPLYLDSMLKARRCIGALACTLSMFQDKSIQSFHSSIETATETLQFLLLRDLSPDII
jgi:hypothetical protein